MVKFKDILRTSSHKFEIPEMSADTLNSNAGISLLIGELCSLMSIDSG